MLFCVLRKIAGDILLHLKLPLIIVLKPPSNDVSGIMKMAL